jgi:hypothetical protein
MIAMKMIMENPVTAAGITQNFDRTTAMGVVLMGVENQLIAVPITRAVTTRLMKRSTTVVPMIMMRIADRVNIIRIILAIHNALMQLPPKSSLSDRRKDIPKTH